MQNEKIAYQKYLIDCTVKWQPHGSFILKTLLPRVVLSSCGLNIFFFFYFVFVFTFLQSYHNSIFNYKKVNFGKSLNMYVYFCDYVIEIYIKTEYSCLRANCFTIIQSSLVTKSHTLCPINIVYIL